MPDPPSESPYPLGTKVNDVRLLQNRRAEINLGLEAAAPESGDRRHTLLLGEPHSGRSSVLAEIARQAEVDRDRLVVWLTTSEEGQTPAALIRHLLIAVVEALAAETSPSADWYLAWRGRVYLRDTGPVRESDLLSSGLLFTSDPFSTVDPAILRRDLSALAEIAGDAGFQGVMVCIDDASTLTEDVGLIESLADLFDSQGDYVLLLAGLPSTAAHLEQAASSCLQRFSGVWISPFYGAAQIYTTLTAPLSGADRDLLQAKDTDLQRDILQLTGGNPYELMVVANHLWMSCKLGEQSHYALTPRVLDRIIPHIAALADEGDALRDWAAAIDVLPEERVGEALELAALSRMSVREIARIRLLKLGNPNTPIDRGAILEADIVAEAGRVLETLKDLEEAGVFQLHPDGERFNVVGGRPVTVLLKYKARARTGAEVERQPFELGYLFTVGRAVARDALLRVLEKVEGACSLGHSVKMSKGALGRHSPRPGIRALSNDEGVSRLIEADSTLATWNSDAYDRASGLLAADDSRIALICTSLIYDGDQLEYLEAWEVPDGVDDEQLVQIIADVVEEWQPLVDALGLSWDGNESAVLAGANAREAMIVLNIFSAASGVHRQFSRWLDDGDPDTIRSAQRIAREAIATMRKTGQSDLALMGELSAMLSRLGFLDSFDEESLDEAEAVLQEALQIGEADGLVTRWNLANVLARKGDVPAALKELELLADQAKDYDSEASALFHIPGKPACESMTRITGDDIQTILDLQRAVLLDEEGALAATLEAAAESKNEHVVEVVEWIRSARSLAA